jgi:hypothetical protein
MRKGAFDFYEKPLNNDALLISIHAALRKPLEWRDELPREAALEVTHHHDRRIVDDMRARRHALHGIESAHVDAYIEQLQKSLASAKGARHGVVPKKHARRPPTRWSRRWPAR